MAVTDRPKFQTTGIMVHVVIALLPGLGVSAWFLGPKVFLVVLVSILAAVATEAIGTRSVQTLRDGSAV
ncbi:MAG: RnfABCDGE type electron transport complex subunit D, partial [Gammaproteobacteria bacterium]|nr:RnfABCDGE type electron transport complex subunit D [Gammaproteobacteria bacterium]